MFRERVILFVIWTFTFLVSAESQQRDQKTKPTPKTNTAAAREAERLRTNATSLLYLLAQSGNEIESVIERVMVVSEVGDALWSVDQDYARSALIRSFQETDKLVAGADRDRERVASQKRALRRIVLSRIAKHDPALANRLIQSVPSEPLSADEKAMRRDGVSTPNGEALLGIAQNLLASDPKKAAALAGYALQDGLSQRLRHFLIALRAKDPAAAEALADAALRQASSQHPGRLFDVMMLWDYIYQPQIFYLNGISWEREGNESRSRPSPLLKRAVLQFAVSAIIENLQQLPASTQSDEDKRLLQQQIGSLYSVIQQLLPSMQADWPPGAIDLQQSLARIERELHAAGQKPPERPDTIDRSELSDSLVDGLLEKAAAASQGDGRDSLYLAAAFKLFQLGKYERAKEVAAKIDDLDRRSMLLDPINFQLAGELAEKGSLTDALSIAMRLKAPELRIDALARIGGALLAIGDAQGNDAINEAQSSASKADPTIEVCAATLRIAGVLITKDPQRAAEMMGLAIEIANKSKGDQSPWPLMSPANTSDPLNFSWKNADGGGLQSVKASYGRGAGLAILLSKLDFEQAVALAKGVKSKGFSLAVQAAICRAAIESTQGKIPVARS
jgi:hypothetical protein